MTTGMSEEQIYEQAKKRVEEKKGFFIHLTVYIVVNIMLFEKKSDSAAIEKEAEKIRREQR